MAHILKGGEAPGYLGAPQPPPRTPTAGAGGGLGKEEMPSQRENQRKTGQIPPIPLPTLLSTHPNPSCSEQELRKKDKTPLTHIPLLPLSLPGRVKRRWRGRHFVLGFKNTTKAPVAQRHAKAQVYFHTRANNLPRGKFRLFMIKRGKNNSGELNIVPSARTISELLLATSGAELGTGAAGCAGAAGLGTASG